jgi:hypothetical protein
MNTLSKTYGQAQTLQNSAELSNWYNRFIEKMTFNYYGFIAMSILITSCLGGITTMQIFENGAPLWQFMISVSFTMANLVACIGQAPTKWVINLFALAGVVNTVLLMINL